MGSGPKLVIAGSIFGSIFLAFFLSALTAGLSYSTVLSAAPPTDQAPLEQTAQQQAPAIGLEIEAGIIKGTCAVSDRFPEIVLQWCDLITHYANKNGLSPDLVAALIWQESGGKPAVYSHSGAVGLMQVMPSDGRSASFMCANGPCFRDRPTGVELEDPEFNISYGTKYLAKLINRHGNLRDALRSYGPMNVGYYYADKVLGLFNQYGE